MTNKELLTKAYEILMSTDGYSAIDFERIGQALDLLKQVQLPEEEIIEHDPTPEEERELEKLDSELFELFDKYSEKGLRLEVVRDAGLDNAEDWFNYRSEYTSEGDDEDNS